MHLPQSDGKLRLQSPETVPVMMGDADLRLIEERLAELPQPAHLLEIGPWLGGVSQKLADHGTLHVVDHFRWSAQNAENHPELLSEGASFRPLFEEALQAQGKAAHIHECDIADFEWNTEPLDFCLIDAPRNSNDLWLCLRQVLGALRNTGMVLIKHGLNPAHKDMMALIEVLITHEILELIPTGQPAWCNIAALKAGPARSQLPTEQELVSWHKTPASLRTHPSTTPPERVLLIMAHLADLAATGESAAAFSALRQQKPDPRFLKAWTLLEPDIVPDPAQNGAFAAFAELVEYHHSAAQKGMWCPPDHSLSWALRHCWCAYAEEKTPASFDLASIVAAFQTGQIDDLLARRHEA